jgi:RNA polymerase sigma factor (sigma-70 family)
MQTNEPDSVLEALEYQSLRARLARPDWKSDPQYVSTEQVFRLFGLARANANHSRIGLFSAVLSRRLLVLAKAFAVRSGIYPGNISDLDQAAEEISQFVWECLFTRPGDAAHAEKWFGQLFKRRAIDFQKRLMAKKRKCQESLDAMEYALDEEDPEKAVRQIAELQQSITPADVLEAKQEHALIAARLQSILTREEHSVYVMLNVDEMQVQEIAMALGVTTRTVNSYKNRALDKIQKEFMK